MHISEAQKPHLKFD